MSVEIREVKTRKELKQFVLFGIRLYSNHPYAAPPLMMDDMTILNKEKNPSFAFCEARYFMAFKDNKMVGRVAGIINHRTNEHWNYQHARFGWLDMIDDLEVTKALLDAVETWAKEKKMTAIHGPVGFTDFDREGMLVEGFDKPGTMATNYNFPYYPQHLAALGYQKDIDWKEYNIQIPKVFPEKHFRIAKIVKEKHQLQALRFRSIKPLAKNYGKKIFDLLNICYKDLYGFSPLSNEQIQFYINLYLSLARPNLVRIVVNQADEVVAFGFSLPSMTKALQKAKGRLFPFGFLFLLKALYGKNKVVDLYLMAVRPDYQAKGASALLFAELIPEYARAGFQYAESNPELETNQKVSTLWDSFETKHVKTRRAFIKSL
ncbi:MAG: hypothetical protein ACP5F6_00040 [Microbacter sp.]